MGEQGTCSVFKSVANNSTSIPFPEFNETIHFGGESKTYRELVYTSSVKYTLFLSIEILTNDSETSRLALRNKRRLTKKIPRPQNPWIIYRRDKYASPEFEGELSSEASVIIGKRWKSESNEVIEYFIALSLLALENHRKKYGNYKYQPKQKISKISKKSSNNRRKQQPKENVENISPETTISTLTVETMLNQDLPQFTVVPPSPNNEYLPTPASSINEYLFTPASSVNEYHEYLPTPASSIQHSPVTFQDGFLDENLCLLTPESSNQHSPITPEEELLMNFNIDSTAMNFNIDSTAMYPSMSDIRTNDCSTFDNNSPIVPGIFSEFFANAYRLALQSSPDTFITNTKDQFQDFNLYSDNSDDEALTFNAPTIIENQVPQPSAYNPIEFDNYDPFFINNTTLFEDQKDFSYYYNGRPINE